jgi:hypothetical protein
MTSIALDLDPTSATYMDLLFVNGDLVLIDGPQEVLQNILLRLGIFLGEWFNDNTIGIDYFGQILVKNPNLGNINAILLNQLLNVPGVIQVNAYSFTPSFLTRSLGIAFKVLSTSGPIDYSGAIQA